MSRITENRTSVICVKTPSENTKDHAWMLALSLKRCCIEILMTTRPFDQK